MDGPTKHTTRNNNTLDYQLRSGPLQGRMVKGQKVTIKRLETAQSTKDPEGPPMYMVSWLEPTGTCVTQVLNLQDLEINTTAFFPDWVTKEPQKTVCFQNDHLDEILSYRNIGPTYPIHHKVMSGEIHFVEDCLVKDENIVNVNASTPMQ
ncbi:hypothetical protein KP509_26G003000 [Ceratopteris richardii]|uniref:Uncharacterized protein n=1 Tax=Ceratopteris richardii TaxID=49495 RepID=A0A8T2RHX2_CERRI|nr:hypothetical protein KP509_26G003000 [Ceratopteris richardii]